MYQNAYYEKEGGIIHCWDDEKGYFTKKYRNYAYVRDGNGSHESIYGERLKKINFWNKEDNLKLYESDVNEMTRFLIDEYGDLIAPQELRDGEGLPSIPSQDQNDQEGRSSSLRVPSNEEDRQLVGDDFLDQTIRRRRSFSDQFELEENR